jgi:hypothetical protein
MSWKRVKEVEKNGVIGHWEHTNGSMITLTKGVAHVVHRGVAAQVQTPEDTYGSNPNTIGKMVAKRLGLIDAEMKAFD